MESRFDCACGHHVNAHEDDDGGTHECQLCDCRQFSDSPEPLHRVTPRTPGPWTLDGDDLGVILGADMTPIQTAGPYAITANGGEAYANARLIAAAPELLDVVELLDAFQVEYQANTHDTLPGNSHYSGKLMAIVTAARAVIDKAKGVV